MTSKLQVKRLWFVLPVWSVVLLYCKIGKVDIKLFFKKGPFSIWFHSSFVLTMSSAAETHTWHA